MWKEGICLGAKIAKGKWRELYRLRSPDPEMKICLLLRMFPGNIDKEVGKWGEECQVEGTNKGCHIE